jgi:hypothetical protein
MGFELEVDPLASRACEVRVRLRRISMPAGPHRRVSKGLRLDYHHMEK